MKYVEKKFRLTGTDSLLGSSPSSKEIFSTFLVDKTKTTAERNAAREDVDNIIENDEKGTTIFYRDKNGGLILKGYHIKGFLKEAAKALKDQVNLKSYLSKVDTYVFVMEKNIPIMRDGKQIMEPDGYLERPLRCETAQGPRVALSKSEEILDPWYVDVTIRVVENAGTAKSAPIDMDMIEGFLDYGAMKGLLQWRNAGHGSFEWEELK